jgi:hypothetical protein
MSDQSQDPVRRRRAVLGLLITGLFMILAVLWGIWSVMHNETGVLIVTSRPSGAEVILNERPTDLLTSAFFSDLPADSFIVSVRLDGYRPVPPTQGVSIQPQETTRVTFLMSPVVRGDRRSMPNASGRPFNWKWKAVNIASDPPGASLIIDDRELGMETPVTLMLESGLHHLKARWPDRSLAFKNIMIDPEQSQPDLVLRPVTYDRTNAPKHDTTHEARTPQN